MRAILRDRSEFYLDELQAERLSQELIADSQGFVVLAGQTIRKSQIVELRKGGIDPNDVPDFDRPAIAGQRCHSQFSIQNAINKLAVKCGLEISDDNPEGVRWSRLVTDQDWRDMMRQKLLAGGGQWCDSQDNRCECEK